MGSTGEERRVEKEKREIMDAGRNPYYFCKAGVLPAPDYSHSSVTLRHDSFPRHLYSYPLYSLELFPHPPHFHSQNIIRLALRSRKNSGSRWRNQRGRMSNLKHYKVVVQGLSARSSPKILGDEIQEYFPHSSCFSCSFCTRGAFLGSLFNGAYAYTKLLAA